MTITLKNLHEATAQQVFNQVSAHMLRQGTKSITDDGEGRCAYRAKQLNGTTLKCAAGALIADDEYTPEMDGVGNPSYVGTDWRELIETGLVPQAHEVLISDLQNVHDRYEPDEWIKQLEVVAHKYNLMMSWPVAKTVSVVKLQEELCF